VPDVKEQIEFFLNMVAVRKLDLPLVLDFENNGGLDKKAVSRAIEDGLTFLQGKVGYRPIVYTGPSWWNRNTVASPRWSQHDLWIANYGNPSPTLPRDWTTWRFWQWTEAGTIPGMPGTVDVNWFNGDENQLKQYAASTMNPQPVPPPSKTGYRIEVTASVNVRKGPSTNHEVVGSLNVGEQFEVLDLAGGEIWLQIGTNRWAAYITGGQQLCAFKAGTPPQITVIATQMNIRSGPSRTTDDVGDLMKDTVLNVSDLGGTDAWVKIGVDRWAAFAKDNRRFMKWLV
jgi:hypothetical protein